VPLEVFANAPAAADATLTAALASAAATAAVVSSVAALPVADPTLAVPTQWRGVFLNAAGQVVERFICTDSRATTLVITRQVEDAAAYPAGVWPVGTAVAHELTAGVLNAAIGPKRWRRYASAAQAFPAGQSDVVLDALDYDTAGAEGAGGSKFTCRRAGLYAIALNGIRLPAAANMAQWIQRSSVAPHSAYVEHTAAVFSSSDQIVLAVGELLTARIYTAAAVTNSLSFSAPAMTVTFLSD